MIKFKVFHYLILLLILSCSHPSNNSEVTDSLPSVEIDQTEAVSAAPKLNTDTGQFGPAPLDNKIYSVASKSKKAIVGLFLGPGLYRVAGHLSLLKEMKIAEVDIHVVSGSGFGALIATYYALGYSPEYIEWKFFRFFQYINKTKPYQGSWQNKIAEHFYVDFKSKKIEEAKLSLLLPVYNFSQKKIVFRRRGEILSLLRPNITSRFEKSDLKGGYLDPSPYLSNFARMKKELNVDILAVSNVLKGDLRLTSANDFVFGYFTKIAGHLEKNRDDSDLIYDVPMNGIALDEKFNITKKIIELETNTKEFALKISQRIKSWGQ